MEKTQIIIEILKGQLISASCQREPKISETLKSCMETLDELDKLVKESDSLPCGSNCQCDSRDWTPFRIEQRVLCGKCDKPITG